MVFTGMTPDQIDVAANQLRAQSKEVQSVRSRVTALVNEASSAWQGQDLRAFRSAWYSSYQSRLVAAANRLDSMASELSRQAAQQREASAANGVSSSPPSTQESPVDKVLQFFLSLLADVPQIVHPKDGVLNVPQPLDGPVGTSDSDMEAQDVFQGDAGDCWFLAAIMSMANTPEGRDLLRNNMVWDPVRQGYVVTLYRNGQPEQYFVDQTYRDGVSGGKTWVSVYEAALAQYMGSGAGVNGGWGTEGFGILTGQETKMYSLNWTYPADTDIDQMRTTLDNGGVVTLGTGDRLGSDFQVTADVQDAQGNWHTSETIDVVARHEYSVDHVDSDGNVYVRNPWGPFNVADGGGLIKLTPDQVRQCFDNYSTGSLS